MMFAKDLFSNDVYKIMGSMMQSFNSVREFCDMEDLFVEVVRSTYLDVDFSLALRFSVGDCILEEAEFYCQ